MAVRARPDNLALEQPSSRDALADSDASLEELWGHHAELQAVCLRMVGDPAKAEDLVQETYVRALQQCRSQRLDRRESFGPWLATVARRRAIDEIRWRRRGWEQPTSLASEPATGAADDPAEQVLQQEVFERIRVAMTELSMRERQLLLRQVTHGLTLAELAEEEATSIASVRSVLSRARGKLRVTLERGGPLGAAPGSRAAAAVRERLHRVVTRLEGAMPSLAAGGAHMGDMVAAAIAAAVLLLGGSTAPAPVGSTSVMTAAAAYAADGVADEPDDGRSTDSVGRKALGVGAAVETAQTPTPPPAPASLGPPPAMLPAPVDVPSLPDSASQPELSLVQHLSASADGATVFASGRSKTGFLYTAFRSTDGGASWQKLAADGFSAGRIIVPPTYPAHPTIFSVNGTTLQRSDDGGQNFLSVAPARTTAALSPDYATGDRRVFLALPHFVAYSADSHTTTPESMSLMGSDAGGIAMLPSFSVDRRALIGTTVRLNPTSAKPTGAVARCVQRDCTATTVLRGTGVAPSLMRVGDVTLAWTPDNMFRSEDDGVSFTHVPTPYGFNMNQMTLGAPGEALLAGMVLQAKQPGLLRSTDGGHTWTPLGAGTAIENGVYTVVRLAGGRIIVGVPGGGVLCSEDAGATWARRCS